MPISKIKITLILKKNKQIVGYSGGKGYTLLIRDSEFDYGISISSSGVFIKLKRQTILHDN